MGKRLSDFFVLGIPEISFKAKTAFSPRRRRFLYKFIENYFVLSLPSSTWIESFCCSKFLNVIREPSGFTT